MGPQGISLTGSSHRYRPAQTAASSCPSRGLGRALGQAHRLCAKKPHQETGRRGLGTTDHLSRGGFPCCSSAPGARGWLPSCQPAGSRLRVAAAPADAKPEVDVQPASPSGQGRQPSCPQPRWASGLPAELSERGSPPRDGGGSLAPDSAEPVPGEREASWRPGPAPLPPPPRLRGAGASPGQRPQLLPAR